MNIPGPIVRQAAPRVGGAPGTSCGPEVTDWFVDLLNNAKKDRLVLAIKQRLEGAQRYGRRFGYDSMAVLEGGLVRKLLAAEKSAGNPARTPDATALIRAADPNNEFGRAFLGSFVPIVGLPEDTLLGALRGASLTWKSLVETGAVFDFKNTVLTRNLLDAVGCPAMCAGDPTITIAGKCYPNDLPGNIFYAYISRFVGFSRNAVHLGSQIAELQPNSSSNWDPPEETAALDLGFDLGFDPSTGTQRPTVSRSELVSAVDTAAVTRRSCTPCSVLYNPNVPLKL